MKNSKEKLNYNKYLNLLQSPQSKQWLMEYEYNLRRQLPKEKLRSLISTMIWFSLYEDSMAMAKHSVFYDVTTVVLPMFRLRGKVTVTEEKLKEYYLKDRKKFINPELKVLKYVFFDKLPSAEDTSEVKERLEDFLLRIKEGEDFLTIAREVSDDTLIEKKFKDINELMPAEAEVYKNLKNGQISMDFWYKNYNLLPSFFFNFRYFKNFSSFEQS